MKAHIKIKAYLSSGNYGVVDTNGNRQLVSDKDIAIYGGITETLKRYQDKGYKSLYKALVNSIYFK